MGAQIAGGKMNAKMKKLSEQLAAEHSQVYVNNDFRIRAHVGFECGFEARDRIAQERESDLLNIMADCADYLENTGSLTTATVSVFNTLRQTLANYKAEDDK